VEFSVRVDALYAFADSLTALGGDAQAAVRYAENYLSIDGGASQLFFTASEATNEVMHAVSGSMAHLKQLAETSAGELRRSADTYRRTDDQEDARLDATYPS
jgi:hypothetical protein